MTTPTTTDHTTPGPAPDPVAARPLLRGWIHLVAVVVTLVAAPFVVARAPTAGAAAALAIYMTSIVALFGVSAAFHRVKLVPGRPPADAPGRSRHHLHRHRRDQHRRGRSGVCGVGPRSSS